MTAPSHTPALVAVAVMTGCRAPATEPAPPPSPAPAASEAARVYAWPPKTGAGPCSAGMVRVVGGTLTLGMRKDEVTVAEFCLDRAEVTVAAYRGCVGAGLCERSMQTIHWPKIGDRERSKWSAHCNGRFDDRDDHPANCVDWTQADAYCRARGAQLPSEAQWEWAARGGEAANPYPWGDQEPDVTRLNACGKECQDDLAERGLEWDRMHDAADGFPTTAPVGSFPAGDTLTGITDLGGNVFEWTATAADDHAPAPSRYKRPGQKIARGGGFRSTSPFYARVELRVAIPPQIRNTYGGFRCATEAE